MAKISENAKKVFNFVKNHDGEEFIAADIAKATGLEIKQVNGIVTSAFQKKGLMERVPAKIEDAEGNTKSVKFIRLTDAGKEFDPDEQDEDEEE